MEYPPLRLGPRNQLPLVMRWLQTVLLVLIVLPPVPPALACTPYNLEVGVCLHVYLERDFLSLETIVYPRGAHRQYNSRYTYEGQPDGDPDRYTYEGQPDEDPASYTYEGQPDRGSLSRGWLEGPELEDSCKRLRGVLECFEEVLLTCDTAYAFFRFRHLLHSLDQVHHFLCDAGVRKDRFVGFLRTIECAEKARQDHLAHSCHRHNVTSNVWNKILRLEVGTEICDSLNTQRSCLLENRYLNNYCRGQSRVDIYTQVSSLFLSTWCRVPLQPGHSHATDMMSGSDGFPQTPPDTARLWLILTCFVVAWEL